MQKIVRNCTDDLLCRRQLIHWLGMASSTKSSMGNMLLTDSAGSAVAPSSSNLNGQGMWTTQQLLNAVLVCRLCQVAARHKQVLFIETNQMHRHASWSEAQWLTVQCNHSWLLTVLPKLQVARVRSQTKLKAPASAVHACMYTGCGNLEKQTGWYQTQKSKAFDVNRLCILSCVELGHVNLSHGNSWPSQCTVRSAAVQDRDRQAKMAMVSKSSSKCYFGQSFLHGENFFLLVRPTCINQSPNWSHVHVCVLLCRAFTESRIHCQMLWLLAAIARPSCTYLTVTIYMTGSIKCACMIVYCTLGAVVHELISHAAAGPVGPTC